MPVHPTVKAGTAAAAASGVVVWLLGRYVLRGHVDLAVQAEVYAAVPAVLTFAAGWLTPGRHPAPQQMVVNVTAGARAQDAGRAVLDAIREYERADPRPAAAEQIAPEPKES